MRFLNNREMIKYYTLDNQNVTAQVVNGEIKLFVNKDLAEMMALIMNTKVIFIKSISPENQLNEVYTLTYAVFKLSHEKPDRHTFGKRLA
jgi:hypothetical protein